jgi:hypothetical protein
MVRPLLTALLATGAAAAGSTFASGAAEPSSTPPQPPPIVGYGFTFEASKGAPPLHSPEACDAGVQIRYPWALYLVSSSKTAPKRLAVGYSVRVPTRT